jgi:zinc transporter ZupT
MPAAAHVHTGSAPTESRTVPTQRTLFVAVLAVALLSLGGAVIAVTTGLSPTVWDAMGPTGRLSIPIPMMFAQLVVAWFASGRRRRTALVCSALLAVVEPVCIVSGFFDGGYADPSRTAGHVAYQLVFVAALLAVTVLALRRFVQLRRLPV